MGWRDIKILLKQVIELKTEMLQMYMSQVSTCNPFPTIRISNMQNRCLGMA